MKNLILLALIAAAAWFGWKHYPELFERKASHEAVIENQTGMTMERIRVTADGHTVVCESLPNGQSARLPFRVENDSDITLEWQYAEKAGDRRWRGGLVPKGPMVQRHIMTVDSDDQVIYRPVNKTPL